jgi:hypothetical protein
MRHRIENYRNLPGEHCGSTAMRNLLYHYCGLDTDDESQIAYLADRLRAETEACSYAALARSRNPGDGISTFNLWGKFHDTTVGHALPDACELALRKTAQRMLGDDTSQTELLMAFAGKNPPRITTGIKGLKELSRTIPGWAEREDCRAITAYASQCMEKFGTGGGNFRAMYSRFLSWAKGVRPDLVDDRLIELGGTSAGRWTELSSLLFDAGRNPRERATWRDAGRVAEIIADLERETFERLGVKIPGGPR